MSPIILPAASPRWTISAAAGPGWNVVTTSNPDAALNFGLDDHMEHDERYVRAREFYDVVTGLWDSFADDAFVRDVESGLYFDPARMHTLNHKGKYLSVRGPLNISRPVQGWPVIVQAGASEPGKQLAAETAELVFAAGGNLTAAKAFYADVKGRLDKLGRNRDHLKILPGAFVVVGDSEEEAKEKLAILDGRVHYDNGISSLSIAIGHDATKFDPDGPLPEIPETNASKSARDRVVEMARRENLTVRQIAQRLGGYAGSKFLGTPKMIADQMEQWLVEEGSDGFNVMFPYLPGGLDDFVDKVVPELQRRGIFRKEYEGTTLRENLGLPRPENRFFPAQTGGGGVVLGRYPPSWPGVSRSVGTVYAPGMTPSLDGRLCALSLRDRNAVGVSPVTSRKAKLKAALDEKPSVGCHLLDRDAGLAEPFDRSDHAGALLP